LTISVNVIHHEWSVCAICRQGKKCKKHGGFPTEVSDMARNMKWSCLPSLLYCISRKTVDTEYTDHSWCMTFTDIVKWRKNEWLWKFWKRNDLYENFEKRGGSRVLHFLPCLHMALSYQTVSKTLT
jgi:hypothetical protein